MTTEIAAAEAIVNARRGRETRAASHDLVKENETETVAQVHRTSRGGSPKCFANDLRQSAAFAIAAPKDAETKGVCHTFNMFQLAFRV